MQTQTKGEVYAFKVTFHFVGPSTMLTSFSSLSFFFLFRLSCHWHDTSHSPPLAELQHNCCTCETEKEPRTEHKRSSERNREKEKERKERGRETEREKRERGKGERKVDKERERRAPRKGNQTNGFCGPSDTYHCSSLLIIPSNAPS